jgi:uncharacterized protein
VPRSADRHPPLVGRAWRWGLLAWIGVACVLFVMAPPPPPRPPPTPEEIEAGNRATALVVREIEQWYAEHGDLWIPWDQAQGHLAIVIDDVGRELHLFEQLLSLRHRLTFSVLPGSVYTAGVQLRLRGDRRRPRDIMLHLPMEPLDGDLMHRGDEAREVFLRTDDSAERLVAKLEQALRRVPTAIGVNNHMGSRLTADRAAMDAIMRPLHARGLWFLDSRTTADTKAELAARGVGLPTVVRHVFLDDDPSEAAIEAALAEAAARARLEPTIAIGHPSVELLDVLRRELPRLHEAGIAIVPASEVVARAHAG